MITTKDLYLGLFGTITIPWTTGFVISLIFGRHRQFLRWTVKMLKRIERYVVGP